MIAIASGKFNHASMMRACQVYHDLKIVLEFYDRAEHREVIYSILELVCEDVLDLPKNIWKPSWVCDEEVVHSVAFDFIDWLEEQPADEILDNLTWVVYSLAIQFRVFDSFKDLPVFKLMRAVALRHKKTIELN